MDESFPSSLSPLYQAFELEQDNAELALFDSLVDSLYSCVNSEAGFKPFLESLATHLNVYSTAVACLDIEHKKGFFGWSHGYPPGLINTLIKTGMIFKDDAVQRCAGEQNGSVYSFSDGDPQFDLYPQLSLTSKAWAKLTNMKDSGAYTFDLDDGRRVGLIVNRNESQGVFVQRDLQLLNRLALHIKRAVNLHVALHKQRQLKEGLDSAILSIDYPMALYDAFGEVSHINPAFKAFGQKHQVFEVDQYSIKFFDQQINFEFNQAILSFCLGDDVRHNQEVLYIRDKSEKLLRIHIRRLSNKDKLTSGVMVEAKDAVTSVVPNTELIRKIIDCSEAEAKVIVSLVEGNDAGQVAEKLFLSTNTVRGYIKDVLKRNDFKRQIDLLATIIKALG